MILSGTVQHPPKGPHANVAIIGGGFSGSMMAVELLRRSGHGVSVILIERHVPGRGVAYGTQFEGHLLNVRAKNMSAYADIPDHFVKWAQRHYSWSVKPDDFLPRVVYGLYISSQLREAITVSSAEFRCIQDEAIGLACTDGGCEIQLAKGGTVSAHNVVLALGNFPPADLQIPGKSANSTRYVSNPWSPKPSIDITRDNHILLIGSGLTSVDVILDLRARGFEGTIHVLSRRGLLPQKHSAVPFPPFRTDSIPKTVRGLLRMIRQHVKAAEARASNWREVVDSLRPVTQQIWQALPVQEQRRFLRHLRPYWDVHRHRIAERIADQIALQIRHGQIQTHAGRISKYQESAEGVEITYRERKNGTTKSLLVDRVVNCTGPDGDFRRVNSPLISDLLESKLARPDDLALGLDVADDGALVDSAGVASTSLFALGPLRKGKLWESVAVPELRIQVAKLGNRLASSLPHESQLSIETARGALATAS